MSNIDIEYVEIFTGRMYFAFIASNITVSAEPSLAERKQVVEASIIVVIKVWVVICR